MANASYKRVKLVDVGKGIEEGKRRHAGLEFKRTNSTWDTVVVVVRKIVVEGEGVKFSEEISVEFRD